jgi:hypothetical protein
LRARRFVVGAAIIATALTGCSSSSHHAATPKVPPGPAPNYAAVLQNAALASAAAGTAHFRSVASSSSAEGDERFLPRESEELYHLRGVSTPVLVRHVDGVEYVHVVHEIRAQLGNPPTPWISIGTPGQPIASLPLGYVVYGAYNVHAIPTIGDAAASYTGTIQVLAVVSRLPVGLRSTLSRYVDLQKGTINLADRVGNTPSFRASIDSEGRLVMIELRSSIDPNQIVVRSSISNFGVPVHVVAPPASQVTPSNAQFGAPA